MPVHLDNESEILDEARAGNCEAFNVLVRQYDQNVYRLALHITGNREDAEDVLQEAFLKAYDNLARFKGGSRFYTWLTRIAVNEALMKLRKRHGDRVISLDSPVECDEQPFMPKEIEDWGDNPEERYAKAELQKILREAVEMLDPAYRVVVILRDIENFSTAEAAEMLNLSIPAMKSRLLRARLQLRETLNQHFTEE